MSVAQYKCLTCSVKIKRKDKYFPFCSKRCSLADLDNWLREKYTIGGENIYIRGSGSKEK